MYLEIKSFDRSCLNPVGDIAGFLPFELDSAQCTAHTFDEETVRVCSVNIVATLTTVGPSG